MKKWRQEGDMKEKWERGFGRIWSRYGKTLSKNKGYFNQLKENYCFPNSPKEKKKETVPPFRWLQKPRSRPLHWNLLFPGPSPSICRCKYTWVAYLCTYRNIHMMFMFAMILCLDTSTKQKANYKLHAHKFRNCILFVYLNVFMRGMCVHKCVGNTFTGMPRGWCLLSFTAL